MDAAFARTTWRFFLDLDEDEIDRQAKVEATEIKRIADLDVQLNARALKESKKSSRAANRLVRKAKWARWLRNRRLVWIGGSFAVGMILIVGSWYTEAASPVLAWRWPWMSDLLMNLGAAFLLFGLFYLLTDRISRRVDVAERDVGQTQSKLQAVSDFVIEKESSSATSSQKIGGSPDSLASGDGATPEPNPPAVAGSTDESDESDESDEAEERAAEIDRAVQQAMALDRANEEALYRKVATHPSSKLIHIALQQAQQEGLVSRSGPRCELLFTDLHIRFVISNNDQSTVVLQIETNEGVVLGSLAWGESNNEADVFAALGRMLKKLGLYPGDQMYFPGQLPKLLSELLIYASKYRHSSTGDSDIQGVIEMLESGWVIMERGLAPQSYRGYLIANSRLDEIDWSAHIRNKPWPEALHVDEALAIARGLRIPRAAA